MSPLKLLIISDKEKFIIIAILKITYEKKTSFLTMTSWAQMANNARNKNMTRDLDDNSTISF